ncbi:ATP-dependent (S)-NAD(P)H-hydrate dehydratase [Seminavis robusta]|uniref:ATP-dependent (S)-NAD(P)H-hydrate dehydratase n=1 Tax=Seminavis robusta TaxID=568900 RepID=A0A9N8DFB6_9STRA|nr:ATP-dependent (S)-NAD(P)H-hydrate dehydratase [Seminavis robusta]|eukprot:Sro97_g050150.1 ATP-dependent (S)-NAD(P)H-hydrate dehydratase (327) ;mRNA; f:104723-105805
MTFEAHKGSSGRVGVLGGSAQYTGAPYYAAMASLKAGADLAYVFCAQEACLPIKSYSPELMVSPVYSAQQFDDCHNSNSNNNNNHHPDMEDLKERLIEDMVQKVTSQIERLHVLVIGPGLGRCPLVFEATARIIQHATTKNLALVLDADALWMLAQPPYRALLKDYSKVVLTPNIVEYKRLFANGNDNNNLLQHATVVQKGQHDKILRNGQTRMECHELGGKKRSGGIGDVLAGTIGTLVAWNGILSSSSQEQEDLVLSCWTACCFVKTATRLAFQDKKRSMTAPDVLEHLGPAIDSMTEKDEYGKEDDGTKNDKHKSPAPDASKL